jgi:predicted dehydrogenase
LKLKVGIIGCGLIGFKRAEAIKNSNSILNCFDVNIENAQRFAAKFNCSVSRSYMELLENENLDVVIISTTHDKLAELTSAAIRMNKHVLVEKPGALNIQEISSIIKEREKNRNIKIHVGYNHRYHPAIMRALEIYHSGDIGEFMFLRARYGHGGRIGYEKEWRFSKEKSGGGELIDQGSHLLDLSLAFLGEASLDYASTPTYFWDTKLDDNAFVSLKNSKNNIAFLHASCTEWKNMFSLEIYCKFGKLDISGLGGSYGTEKLTLHKMKPNMGIPESYSWEYPGNDLSWQLEMEEFFNDINNDSKITDNLNSSILVLKLISDIYERSTN